ncbi:hypothetical protein CANARDRAFT_8702 [[Candida] arabinofermentans NRRL YB-2248]|uniref:ATP-dependent DNA helicase n=1 Tax=[Candida] arabinofermentans NRRL YB-2248 TaxID=983967 RepID=A0A1E4SXX4_9ASCO|nr:hypothetical protein CANARDRAFT_8702 [[Candida] arabinofermentans NRRL YB-2248]
MLSSEDEFSDDGDLAILQTSVTKKAVQITPSAAINRYSNVVKTGQHTLDGDTVQFVNENGSTTIYEEIREKNVTFGPTHHQLNRDNLESYLYPTNLEVRDYQFDIVSKALYENIFCALPTGLGKTFIASTVMLNFYRWTTNSKVIFMAPTRPLVAQQIKACYGITGIPSDDTAILLDKTKKNRSEIWNSKRVFFTTPQVVENDLKGGLLDPKDVVCIVVDEAHRAKGNYAYNNVVTFVKRFNTSFRILALSATPGADVESIQEIVNNLEISSIEVRTENSPDIRKYMKTKDVEMIDCGQTEEIRYIVELISEAILPVLRKANASGIYDIQDPAKINHFIAMEKSQKIVRNPTLSEGIKWTYYFQLQLLGTVGQMYRRLNIYGVTAFYSYFTEKYTEFTTKYESKKSTNKIAASFYYHAEIKKMKSFVERLISEDGEKAQRGEVIKGVFSHTKLQRVVDELQLFFDKPNAEDSKVIIFTEFRESALEIVKCAENSNKKIHSSYLNGHSELIRPHIFIGQSKERDKFDQEKYLKQHAPKGKKKKNNNNTIPNSEPEIKSLVKGRKERPTTRVGSSEDAQTKGMNQKMQKELINEFKKGTYNVLVATSIGEEGLDIGEVDLIVCFDSTSSPIKNIQRMGRTGRKRDGKIILLHSSSERQKFDKAMDNYEWIQNQISNGSQLEFRKSDRIVPSAYKPFPEKKFITIPKANEEIIHQTDDNDEFLRLATQLTTKTRKRNGKSTNSAANQNQQKIPKRFFMPENVDAGFRSASNLVKEVINTDAPQYDTKQQEVPHRSAQQKRKRFDDVSDVSDEDDNITLSQLLGSSTVNSSNLQANEGPLQTSINDKDSGSAISHESEEDKSHVSLRKRIKKSKLADPAPSAPSASERILIDLDFSSSDELSSFKSLSGNSAVQIPETEHLNILLADKPIAKTLERKAASETDVEEVQNTRNHIVSFADENSSILGSKTTDCTVIEDSEDNLSDYGDLSALLLRRDVNTSHSNGEHKPNPAITRSEEHLVENPSAFDFSDDDIQKERSQLGDKSGPVDLQMRKPTETISINLDDSGDELSDSDIIVRNIQPSKELKTTVLKASKSPTGPIDTPTNSDILTNCLKPTSSSASVVKASKTLGVRRKKAFDIVSCLKSTSSDHCNSISRDQSRSGTPRISLVPIEDSSTPFSMVNKDVSVDSETNKAAGKKKKSENKLEDRSSTPLKQSPSVLSQLKKSHKVDPIFQSNFGALDGFMTPGEEHEFYSKMFVGDMQAVQLDFNVIDDPVVGIKRGAVTGGVCHSSSMSSLIDVVRLMSDKRKLDMSINELRDYHEQNQIYDLSIGNYLLNDKIVSDMHSKDNSAGSHSLNQESEVEPKEKYIVLDEDDEEFAFSDEDSFILKL